MNRYTFTIVLSIASMICATVFMLRPIPVRASITVQPIPTVGLTAHWTFDSGTVNWAGNTVSDVSGNSNTGTLMFMDVGSNQVAGKRAQALYFDGILDYVSLAANPLSSLSTANSMCAWVRDNDINQAPAGWNQTFLNLFTNASNGISVGSVANSGVLFASYRSGGAYYGAKSTGSVFVSGTWVHVCYVWNGAGIDLYANGAAIASTTNSDTIGGVNTIGARNDLGDGAWLGSVDDMRIYSRTLSAAEVKLIYQSGALVFKSLPNKSVVLQKTTQNFLNDGLIGYWSFDGGKTNWATNSATDSSGNGNTGTLINMSTTTSPVQGKMGQALLFDGVNDYVTNTTSTMVSKTITAWINMVSCPDRNGIILVNAGNYHLLSCGTNGSAFSTVPSSSASAGSQTNNTYADNKWHFVAALRDSNQIYVDGVLQTTSVDTNNYTGVDSNVFEVGRRISGKEFKGSVDDVRIYNRALSATEILQLYNQGR